MTARNRPRGTVSTVGAATRRLPRRGWAAQATAVSAPVLPLLRQAVAATAAMRRASSSLAVAQAKNARSAPVVVAVARCASCAPGIGAPPRPHGTGAAWRGEVPFFAARPGAAAAGITSGLRGWWRYGSPMAASKSAWRLATVRRAALWLDDDPQDSKGKLVASLILVTGMLLGAAVDFLLTGSALDGFLVGGAVACVVGVTLGVAGFVVAKRAHGETTWQHLCCSLNGGRTKAGGSAARRTGPTRSQPPVGAPDANTKPRR